MKFILPLAMLLFLRDALDIGKAYRDWCERSTIRYSFIGGELRRFDYGLAACLSEAPDCIGTHRWTVAGLEPHPHHLCSYDELPNFMKAH